MSSVWPLEQTSFGRCLMSISNRLIVVFPKHVYRYSVLEIETLIRVVRTVFQRIMGRTQQFSDKGVFLKQNVIEKGVNLTVFIFIYRKRKSVTLATSWDIIIKILLHYCFPLRNICLFTCILLPVNALFLDDVWSIFNHDFFFQECL